MISCQVRKKSGILENWNPQKIEIAIGKSANRISVTLSDEEKREVVRLVEEMLPREEVIPIETVHTFVEIALGRVRSDVCESYRDYRNFVKKFAHMMESVYDKCNSIQFLGDKDNSNADTALVSTKRTKYLDVLSTKLYEEFFLTAKEKEAAEQGYIYIHDKGARRDTMNCCLFDIGKVLSGGFEMNNVWYNEPKTVDTACDVIGDITLMAASQQYGGFTLPEIDSLLAPYAEKSFQKYLEKYQNRCHMSNEDAKDLAIEDTIRDLEQGFQGWEYKFNTVASSRGDYPFITISLGLSTSFWGKEVAKAALKVRREGQGKEHYKKPVLFPKIVFLYDENLHGEGGVLEDVFEAGIACSMRAMYPDWLSLTGTGYVASMYQKYGLAISPMGCRAFLSPWYEKGGMYPADEEDRPVFIGRFNIGAVSLNLPMILAKARRENADFYQVLDNYLELIRGLHLRTYAYLGEMRASTNPLAYCEGGFYGGNLSLEDKIAPVLESATASFGITALNELQRLYNGKSLVEDGDFALEVLSYINDKVAQFKKEDGKLYALYGTPAESLCARQVVQFRKEFGILPKVSDKKYVSNSFHCHVSEDITPIEKQDLEYFGFHKMNGGHIQYVKYPIHYNREAVKSLVRRAMELGFYEGVNMSLAYCEDCGYEELEMDTCPKCGSRNLTKIDRMNGYLSYSRVHGDTRLNEGKMEEIADRKSM